MHSTGRPMCALPLSVLLAQTALSRTQQAATPREVTASVPNEVVLDDGASIRFAVKKHIVRNGELDVEIDNAKSTDDESAVIGPSTGPKGRSHIGAMKSAIDATSLVFWPAAPSVFVHGQDTAIPRNIEITAYLHWTMPLDAAKFAPTTPSTVGSSSLGTALIVPRQHVIWPNCVVPCPGTGHDRNSKADS